MDKKRNAHGELVLLGFKKEINLNHVLLSKGHALYFEDVLRGDLEAKELYDYSFSI